MRFAKIHPSFLIFFVLSVVSLAVAFFLAIASGNACTTGSGNPSDDPTCSITAQGQGTMATVLALGGLTAMIGGIGFQIGRVRTDLPPGAGQQGFGAAPPPYPVPAYPAQQPYPVQQPAYPVQPPAYPAQPAYPAPPTSTPPSS
ncbi:MAG TPA: hypothetical protein VGJ07_32230 [Rugosimonospora sp.]